ncbi:unnamed protein product, partial [Mesorhabditis spiculigera]
MGGHQASITSQQENDFVHGLVSYREMFTGGAYFGSNPVYVNSDGRPFSNFENWEDGSRPAMNRARRCIKVNEYGKWFQSCCKQYGATVCKKPSPQPVADGLPSADNDQHPDAVDYQVHNDDQPIDHKPHNDDTEAPNHHPIPLDEHVRPGPGMDSHLQTQILLEAIK